MSDDEQENDLSSSIVNDARKMTSAKFIKAMMSRFPGANNALLANVRAEFDDSHWGDLLDAAQEHPHILLLNIHTLLETYEFPIGDALHIFCSQEPSDEEDKDRVFEKIFVCLLQFTNDKEVIKNSFREVAKYSFKEKAQQLIRKLKEKLLTEKEWADLESPSKLQAESYLEAADAKEEEQSSESDCANSDDDDFIEPSDSDSESQCEAQSEKIATRASRKRSHAPDADNSDSDFDPDEHQAEREARKEAKRPKREKSRAKKKSLSK